MRFDRLLVANLRAVSHFEIDDLPDFVVIAGPNGSGKSCILDAIRLIKSSYGGYQANEYQHWFGEFQVNLQDPASLHKLFRDTSRSIRVEATIDFTDEELEFVAANAERLVQPLAWLRVLGQPIDLWSFNRAAVLSQLRQFQPQLTAASTELCAKVRSQVPERPYHLSMEIEPSGEVRISDALLIETAFQAYEPANLGIIEYHSASRSYARQQVGGINLDTRAFEDQQRQSRLYNWQSKYQNIKTELATSYLRRMIAEQSGMAGDEPDDLNSTLTSLFETFFPDKKYLGVRPQPGGSLEFPVELASGETHDIDELSSGEKEILYGYLKLRNSTPARSVILLDEPELHLNPSLLHGFADFYYEHLGIAQRNQLWLVTHSDTLLRQAVGNPNYRTYHMVPATSEQAPANQAVEVVADDDVERVTIDLVGDLASYRPHGKVVILEGESESGFDVRVVRRLFPQLTRSLNLVSGGSKRRVRDLHDAMQSAAQQAGLKNRFFHIVDRDNEIPSALAGSTTEFTWDVYHIENYLLEPAAVRAAKASLLGSDPHSGDEEVLDLLRSCAELIVESLVFRHVRELVNSSMVQSIAIGAPPDGPVDGLLPSIEMSSQRLTATVEQWTADHLSSVAGEYRDQLHAALAADTWRADFPGRAVLRRFADGELKGRIDASLFANAVLDKAVELHLEPPGMHAVLVAIVNA